MWKMVFNRGNHSLWILREWGDLTFSIIDITPGEESIGAIRFPALVLVYHLLGTLYGRSQLRGQDHRSWASREGVVKCPRVGERASRRGNQGWKRMPTCFHL